MLKILMKMMMILNKSPTIKSISSANKKRTGRNEQNVSNKRKYEY